MDINKSQLKAELDCNYVVVTEALQTRLKVLGIKNTYEKMKELTRNYEDDKDIKKKIIEFIDQLHVSDAEKDNLKSVTSHNYVGFFP